VRTLYFSMYSSIFSSSGRIGRPSINFAEGLRWLLVWWLVWLLVWLLAWLAAAWAADFDALWLLAFWLADFDALWWAPLPFPLWPFPLWPFRVVWMKATGFMWELLSDSM